MLQGVVRFATCKPSTQMAAVDAPSKVAATW
jgi:hypothetical protein